MLVEVHVPSHPERWKTRAFRECAGAAVRSFTRAGSYFPIPGGPLTENP